MSDMTSGKLGLQTFQNGANGWARGANKNFEIIDGRITALAGDVDQRALDIERLVASFSQLIEESVDQADASAILQSQIIITAIVNELKTYIDQVLDTPLERAQTNQSTIIAAITTERARLDRLEALITAKFNTLESSINSGFVAIDQDLISLYDKIVQMRDLIVAQLAALAHQFAEHIDYVNNPNEHRVTFEQMGGSAALRYIADPDHDARYI